MPVPLTTAIVKISGPHLPLAKYRRQSYPLTIRPRLVVVLLVVLLVLLLPLVGSSRPRRAEAVGAGPGLLVAGCCWARGGGRGGILLPHRLVTSLPLEGQGGTLRGYSARGPRPCPISKATLLVRLSLRCSASFPSIASFPWGRSGSPAPTALLSAGSSPP